MYSIFYMIALVGSLASAAHSWVPIANDTSPHAGQQLVSNSQSSWLGWGANACNNRWASSYSTVDSSNVADLQPFCRQEYPVGVSAAPLVVDFVAYYVTWSGALVALDYINCKELWQTNITEIILSFQPLNATILSITIPAARTTPVMDGNTLFVGTVANALLLAIDRKTGNLIDKVQISKYPVAIITQSPTVWHGRILVGSSSMEEVASAVIPGYICCSFIGSMNAFTLEEGRLKLLWSQSMIPLGSNFSGAAIWGAEPSIDPKRNQVFIATGNVYSTPPQYIACLNATANSSNISPNNQNSSCVPQDVYQESVLALDVASGHINWSHELSPLDAWTAACIVPATNPANCPPSPGQDADFGMAPSFVPASEYTPFSKDTLVVGQKNGNLYAMGAQTGDLFWATATSPDGDVGGLIWGIAVDKTAVYYTAANTGREPWRLQNGTPLSNSAFGALNLTTGTILWETPVPANDTSLVPPSIANDVVLIGQSGTYAPSGALVNGRGSLISLDKSNGVVVRSWTLDSLFEGGIAVVDDVVLFGTGYATTNGSFSVWKVGMGM